LANLALAGGSQYTHCRLLGQVSQRNPGSWTAARPAAIQLAREDSSLCEWPIELEHALAPSPKAWLGLPPSGCSEACMGWRTSAVCDEVSSWLEQACSHSPYSGVCARRYCRVTFLRGLVFSCPWSVLKELSCSSSSSPRRPREAHQLQTSPHCAGS